MRGTSIIGPAKLIKQIKRDPESISILMKWDFIFINAFIYNMVNKKSNIFKKTNTT
jgi:hypothetical protein